MTELIDWLREHIFTSFLKKKEGIGIRNFKRIYFPEPLWPFYGGPYKKKLESYKVGHWKFSFGRDATIKEE